MQTIECVWEFLGKCAVLHDAFFHANVALLRFSQIFWAPPCLTNQKTANQ